MFLVIGLFFSKFAYLKQYIYVCILQNWISVAVQQTKHQDIFRRYTNNNVLINNLYKLVCPPPPFFIFQHFPYLFPFEVGKRWHIFTLIRTATCLLIMELYFLFIRFLFRGRLWTKHWWRHNSRDKKHFRHLSRMPLKECFLLK